MHIFINDHKTIITFMHRTTWANLGTGRIFAVVTGNGEIVGENVLSPDAVVFLPVTSGVFVNPAETDVGREILVVFAGQFAGFASGATTGINKNPY